MDNLQKDMTQETAKKGLEGPITPFKRIILMECSHRLKSQEDVESANIVKQIKERIKA